MDERLLQIAAEAIRIPAEEAAKYWKTVPGHDELYYAYNPVRGGLAVILNQDGEKLVATSGVSLQKHLDTFLCGRRN